MNKKDRLTYCLQNDIDQALRIIYDNYYYNLKRVAYYIISDWEAADDVMQDCIIKVWLLHKEYDPKISSAYTWLYQIVRNKAIDVKRGRQNVSLEDYHFKGYAVINTDVIDLKDHISKLSYKSRPIIEMYLKGETLRQIASTFGVAEGTVKGRFKRAKQKLKSIYTNSLDTKKHQEVKPEVYRLIN